MVEISNQIVEKNQFSELFTIQSMKPGLGVLGAGVIVALICFGIGFWSLWTMDETFGKELDYSK